MRTFEVEVTRNKEGHYGIKLGKFPLYRAVRNKGNFAFNIVDEAERKAAIRACEYIAEILRKEV